MAPTATDHWSLSDDEAQSKLPFDVSINDDVFDEQAVSRPLATAQHALKTDQTSLQDLGDLSPLNASPVRGDEYLSPIIHRTPTMRRSRRKSESDSPQTVVYIGGGDSGSPLRYAAIQKPRIADLPHHQHHQKEASKQPPALAAARPNVDTDQLVAQLKELLTTQFVELRSTLRVELAQVRSELVAEVGEVRKSMKREIEEVKEAHKQEVNRLRDDINIELDAAVAEIDAGKKESAQVEVSLDKVKIELLESNRLVHGAIQRSSTNLQDDLTSTRSSLREAIDEVQISIKDDVAQLKREMSESKVELKIAIDASKAAIETEMAQLGRDTEEDKVELMNAIKAVGESVTGAAGGVQDYMSEVETDLKALLKETALTTEEATAKLQDDVAAISRSLSTLSTTVGSAGEGKSIIDSLRSIEQSTMVQDQPAPLTKMLERLSRLTSATSNLHWHSTQAHTKILAQQTEFGITLSNAAENIANNIARDTQSLLESAKTTIVQAAEAQLIEYAENSDQIIETAVENLKAETNGSVLDALSKANTIVDKALKTSTTAQDDRHQRLEILIADVKRETASLSESRKAEARDLIRTIGKIDDAAARSNKIIGAIEQKVSDLKFVKDDLLLFRFDESFTARDLLVHMGDMRRSQEQWLIKTSETIGNLQRVPAGSVSVNEGDMMKVVEQVVRGALEVLKRESGQKGESQLHQFWAQ
jgi:hypothetical protein